MKIESNDLTCIFLDTDQRNFGEIHLETLADEPPDTPSSDQKT